MPKLALLLCALLSSETLAAPIVGADCPQPDSCPAIGKPAPLFGLPLASGGRTSLRELLERKRPVIVDFWRYDCAPCLVELSVLEKLAAEWEGKVSVQLVHVGEPETEMNAKLGKFGGPHLACAFDENQCTGARYCVSAFPQLWVVGADGLIKAHLEGEPKEFEAAVRAAVAPLLAASR